MSSDKYWAHPEHLKNLIECLVILRGQVDFQPTAQVRAASTKINSFRAKYLCSQSIFFGDFGLNAYKEFGHCVLSIDLWTRAG